MPGEHKYSSTEVHGDDNNELTLNYEWWTEKKDQAHKAVFNMAHKIHHQNDLKTQLVINGRFYNNKNLLSYAEDLTVTADINLPSYKPRYNVIKSAIDSLANRIGKARPRPFFLTEKGNSSQQNRAKKLQQYIDGWFDYTKIYEKSKTIFRDACIFKCGFIKIFSDGKKIKAERTNPFEISVEQIDGMYEDPKCMYQTKWSNKQELIKKYPKKKAIIDLAGTQMVNSEMEVVKVIEAWRRGERRVVAVDTGSLVDESYKKDYFPFVVWRYENEMLGFWGEDVISVLEGIQSELDRMMRRVSDAIERIAVPRVFLHSTSKVPDVSFTNKIGKIIRWGGSQPPIFDTAQAMTPEVYGYIESLIEKAYKELGLSSMSTTAEKPGGLNSGKALRTYQDIESDRFANISQRWDGFFLDVAYLAVLESDELFSEGNKTIKGHGSNFIESMKWKDINLPQDAYVTRIFSTNLLPSQPAAKIESVRELSEMGAIPSTKILDALDFPDLEKFKSEDDETTTNRLVDFHIEKILEKSEYNAPDPECNVPSAHRIANSRYIESLTLDIGEEKLEMLARYVQQLKELMPQPAPELPPGAMDAIAKQANVAQAPVAV